MSECDEVARAMLPHAPTFFSMQAAREYVRKQMPEEGPTLIDNVAWALYHGQVEAAV